MEKADFERVGDVVPATDDAEPAGVPAPDAAPLPPPPVPAFLEGVSAPTEPVAPNTVSAPSTDAAPPAAAPPPPPAPPPAAAPAAPAADPDANKPPWACGPPAPSSPEPPPLPASVIARASPLGATLPRASPPRVPVVTQASPLPVPAAPQPAVTVPRALRELAAHNTPATTTALMAAAAPPPPPPVTGLRFKGGVSSETAAALQRAGAAPPPPAAAASARPPWASGPPAPPYSVGDLVEVKPDWSPGCNREGGPGRVTAVNSDGTYDVKYSLGRGTMQSVPLADLSIPSKQSQGPGEAAKRSRRRQPTRRFSELAQDGQNYGDPVDEPPPPKRRPKKKRALAVAMGTDLKPAAALQKPAAVAQPSRPKDPPLPPGLWGSSEALVFNTQNPKRGMSAERYDRYKAATTVAEFAQLGGSTSDLRFDLARGYARVLNPAMQPAPSSPRGRRCGVCAGCLAQDCRQCPFCLDQKRYGGPGKLHRTCQRRNCEAPLPSAPPPNGVKRKAPVVQEPKKRGRKPAAKVAPVASKPAPKRSPQKVPDRAGLEARMTADGWTREEKPREGSTHVDKYFVPPNGGKKLRSILEVARAHYPSFIVQQKVAPPRPLTGTSAPGHVWNQNEPEVDELTGVAYQPCGVCKGKKGGELLMCDGKDGTCDRTAHTGCLNKEFPPEGDWFCAQCRAAAQIASAPPFKKPTKKRKSAAKKAADLQRLGPEPRVRFNDSVTVIQWKAAPRAAPRKRGEPVLEDDATRRAIAASLAQYNDDDGSEYSDDSEEPDDDDGGEWSPDVPAPVVKKKPVVKKSPPPPPPPVLEPLRTAQRFAVGARVEARWEGEWWPAIVDQVCDDAYEVEWVEEPEVFNRLDLEDVRAARASPHFVAAPPTVPPAWTNAAAALATSSPPSKGGTIRQPSPLAASPTRVVSRSPPPVVQAPPSPTAVPAATGRWPPAPTAPATWPPRAEPAPLLPMAVAPPPSVPPLWPAGAAPPPVNEPNGTPRRPPPPDVEMTPRAEHDASPGATPFAAARTLDDDV